MIDFLINILTGILAVTLVGLCAFVIFMMIFMIWWGIEIMRGK